jgi:hypothetical protein
MELLDCGLLGWRAFSQLGEGWYFYAAASWD